MKNKKFVILFIVLLIVIASGSIFYFVSVNKHKSINAINNNSENIIENEKAKVDVPVVIDVENSDNAKIYIDGVLIGEGKAETKIKEGAHSLKVVDDKKGDYIEPFFLSKDIKVFKKTVKVQPKGRAITFVTGIENSTIFIDGVKIITFNNSIEIMIPIGKHTIEISSPGYENFKKELNITKDSETSLNISLKEQK